MCSASLVLLPQFTMVIFFVCWDTWGGLRLDVCSISVRVSSSFTLTLTLLGRVILLIIDLSLTTVSLGTSLIAWKSKKQTAVSRSSAEAELRALVTTTSEIIWLRWLLIDLGVHCDNHTPLFCDNTSVIQIASDPVKHELTKHISVDASFTRSHCQQSTITLKYVPSELQVADFFTKDQTREHHRLHLLKLSISDPPNPPWVWMGC